MKTIKIEEDAYKILKLYCVKNNIKISKWAQNILINEVKNEKRVEKKLS